ncbi:DUF1129 family protein [Paenibacillus lemnae]|uniref:DUF1129 domain-containing protein n=1 Tax=Paenibacillus lemnae TaxID=1330551 RepID=A0A848MBN3_PAELE|nr:DUF1129 family protein [Paenibacillus lemnae]NMO97433.1 DUF1129 domain-containing protein [Paenibacillus lemnae]
MNVKKMIAENNRLQAQMTPDNLNYYEDMVVYIRFSKIDETQGEELLLEMAQHILEAQEQGRTAEDVFGTDPKAYCADLVENLPKPDTMSTLKLSLMIPWVALTWFFLPQALAGLLAIWFGGDVEKMSQVRLSTLLLIAGGSFVLIHLVMSWMKRTTFTKDKNKRSLNFGSMAVYLIVLAAIVGGGILLSPMLPVLSVSPWVSLALFAIGLAGTKLFFMRA